jgi:plasmid stabilization system protein ParE
LLSIYRYVAERNPAAAQGIMNDIAGAARLLVRFPQLGRPSDGTGIRLLQVPGRPSLLPYRMADGDIEILGVFDERQERPPEWT